MIKTASVIAVVVAQLLSWSGAPMYLCMACDGSMRLDTGPASCSCEQTCEYGATSADSHDDHCVCQPDDSHEHASVAKEAVASPCDCSHVRISQEQQSIANSPARSPALDHASLALLADCNLHTGGLSLQTSSPPGRSLAGDPGPLTTLSSVILRC